MASKVVSLPFYSRLKRCKTIPSLSGDKVVDKYGLVYDEVLGRKVLQVTGKEDIYQIKQVALSGTYLRSLLDRYEKGLTEIDFDSMLDTGHFVDLTSLPKTLAEYQKIMIDAEAQFMSLKPSVRSEFGSFSGFLSALQNGSAQVIFDKFSASSSDASSDASSQSSFSEVKNES